ncbi:NAD(P)/FAD-dependent oxidoreductase [Thalassoroseus pseudoceratinae]|uniref:NAD(P)/FAD-dependent oxidoreductase n=1 Tax=Thalassoroseus pseudoceratinae TaxID=2713176 RepID=UPI00141E4B7B|nr:FAD-dependent oxidoreductase [Thalassoroseus pseudoceratinae]
MSHPANGDTAIVVGGGIIGIACAHYLSEAGLQVTVLDRGKIAGACSHANCGFICPSHVLPLTEPGAIKVAFKSLFNRKAPFRVKPQLNPAFWNWMWQFARRCHHRQMLESGRHLKAILDASMSEYRRLVVEEEFDCDWQERGLLYVLETEHGMQEFAKTDQILSNEFGVPAQRIDSEELKTFEPALKTGLAGAFHYPHDTSLRPDLLASQWSERLRKRGVKFQENCPVHGVGSNNSLVNHLATSTGELKADYYVFATGAWSRRLSRELKCSIPVQPGKGYSVTMTPPNPSPAHPMLFPEHKVGVTPFADRYRIGSMMEFVGYDTSIPERRISQLQSSAASYLNTPTSNDVYETWYGFRPMTWDSLPIIGRVPKLQNVYLATGHNMLGMSLATATGRIISELVTRQTPHIDPAPFSPSRFN